MGWTGWLLIGTAILSLYLLGLVGYRLFLNVKSLKAELSRSEALAEQNSILNRFMTNLQSRIYSQLAKQLADNLFAEGQNDTGSFQLDGNQIEYEKSFDSITLRITAENGDVTTLTMPIGSFSF